MAARAKHIGTLHISTLTHQHINLTLSEENYLKTIYHLSPSGGSVSTNAIAEKIETKASSVTDMLKKLAEKNLVAYKRYQGVSLTDAGLLKAKIIVRKHRLWEVFLVEKLGFAWDEVHDVAEELEHVSSIKLIDRLDAFLGFPTGDPHGDPIPDARGRIAKTEKKLLSELSPGNAAICTGVKDSSPDFLRYLDRNGIALGSEITVVSKEVFDQSLVVRAGAKEFLLSPKIAANLYVRKI